MKLGVPKYRKNIGSMCSSSIYQRIQITDDSRVRTHHKKRYSNTLKSKENDLTDALSSQVVLENWLALYDSFSFMLEYNFLLSYYPIIVTNLNSKVCIQTGL